MSLFSTPAGARSGPSGEIDFIEFLLILSYRRRLVLTLIVLAALGAVAAGFFVSDEYRYSTVIEIGRVPVTGVSTQELHPIVDHRTVISMLKTLYLPEAVRALSQQSAGAFRAPELSISDDGDQSLLVLQTRGAASASQTHLALLNEVNRVLLEDHARLLDVFRQDLQQRLSAQKARLSQLSNNPSGASSLATLALIQARIDTLESQLHWLRDTRVVSAPARSSAPVSQRRLISTAVVFVFAVGIALMLVLSLEFMRRTREEVLTRLQARADGTQQPRLHEIERRRRFG